MCARPWIIFVHRVMKPDARAAYVTHVCDRSERAHAALASGIVVHFTFGICDAVFLIRRQLNPVLREFLHAKTLVAFLGIHGGNVMQFAILVQFILLRLLNVMQKHDEEKV